MRLKIIARYIGVVLILNAVFMFISAGVSALYGFDNSFSPLILAGIVTLVVAMFPFIFVHKSNYDVNAKEGLMIVVLSWLFSCLFGMMPYVLYGGEFSVINAWFESVSGYTTTGATVLTNVEDVPKGLLFWRSSTHWLGGVGVVLFMLLFLPAINSFRMKISRLEISSLSQENFKFKAQQTIRVIIVVYLILTVSETILLMIAGMDLFDAVNHTFSTVATGGFSTKNLSVAYFNSFPIELIIMIFMMLSGMHFGLLFLFITGKSINLFRSPVIKYYVISMLVGGLAVALNIKFQGNVSNWGDALRQSFFQVIACGTTTGFGSADSSGWPGFAIMVITFFTIQCACSGSTSGGMKADRVWIFFKSLKTQFKRQSHPNSVIPVKVGNIVIDSEVVYSVNLFIIFYLIILFGSAILLTLFGVSVIDSITGSAACIGNVGPGFGNVGSLGNYSGIPMPGKFLLTLEMLLGRMEIFTLLLVFGTLRKSRRVANGS